MLAVAAMNPTIRTVCFAAAVVLFVVAALGYQRGKISFVAAGLAAFALPFLWDSFAAM